jgi:hypothetical protein
VRRASATLILIGALQAGTAFAQPLPVEIDLPSNGVSIEVEADGNRLDDTVTSPARYVANAPTGTRFIEIAMSIPTAKGPADSLRIDVQVQSTNPIRLKIPRIQTTSCTAKDQINLKDPRDTVNGALEAALTARHLYRNFCYSEMDKAMSKIFDDRMADLRRRLRHHVKIGL